MRGFAGASFKGGVLTNEQCINLYNSIMSYADNSIGAVSWFENDVTYLLCLKEGALSIIGFGTSDNDTKGILWGSNTQDIIEAFYGIYSSDTFIRYKVEPGTLYYVENGQILLSSRQKKRVKTPYGLGIDLFREDDNIVCVQLDSDNTVLYEFSPSEIEEVKQETK